jgi:hypothetical protein
MGISSSSAVCRGAMEATYKCKQPECADLVAGYMNYFAFVVCDTDESARPWACILLILWLLFVMRLRKGLTDDYFCNSMQLSASTLRMPPVLTGAVLLAVGNAIPDVISSFVAFKTNAAEVGVGSTLGSVVFGCTGE